MDDFSRFDRVLAPVIIVSTEFHAVYSNPFAKRQFPLLASFEGLRSYFSEDVLLAALPLLKEGQAVSLSMDDDVCQVLLEPLFCPDGTISSIRLYVTLDSSSGTESLIFPSEGEMLRALHREVLTPICDLLRRLRVVSHYPPVASDPSLGQSLKSIRKRLIRVSLFLSRTESGSPSHPPQVQFCDANGILCNCAKRFSPMKYEDFGPCFIPVSRDTFLRVVLDTMTCLFFRQSPGGTISVRLDGSQGGVRIAFQSDSISIPLDQPCRDELTGIETGLFSVLRQMNSIGGDLLVSSRSCTSACITLTFPEVRSGVGNVILRDPERVSVSPFEEFALEFLQLISQGDDPSF